MEPLKATAATMKMHEEFRVFVRFYSSPFDKAASCERPTSDAYVCAMHSHGNRFLIFFKV